MSTKRAAESSAPRVYPWIKVVRFLGTLLGLWLLWVNLHRLLSMVMNSYDHGALWTGVMFVRLALILFAFLLLFPWHLVQDPWMWRWCYTYVGLMTVYALLPRFHVFSETLAFTSRDPWSSSAVFILQGFYTVVLCFQPLALLALHHRLPIPKP